MQTSQPVQARLTDRPLARLGLLLAVVLHVLGTGLLPVLHREIVPPGRTAVHAHQHGDDGCLPPSAHHAPHCTVCGAMDTRSLPATVLHVPDPAPARMAAADAPAGTSLHLRSRSAPARAPPRAA